MSGRQVSDVPGDGPRVGHGETNDRESRDMNHDVPIPAKREAADGMRPPFVTTGRIASCRRPS